MDYWILSYHKQDVNPWKYGVFLLTHQFFYNLNLDISRTVTPNLPHHFWKELNKIFLTHLHILPKLWLIFCCHRQKIQKMSHFWHFNDHNWGSKLDNKISGSIFLTSSLSSIRWYLSFCISRPLKSNFIWVSPLNYFLVCPFTCQKRHLNLLT